MSKIGEIINKLEESLSGLLISQTQKKELLTHIETVKKQVKSPNHSRQAIVSVLGSIRDILQTLPAGQAIVIELISNIGHLLKGLGLG